MKRGQKKDGKSLENSEKLQNCQCNSSNICPMIPRIPMICFACLLIQDSATCASNAVTTSSVSPHAPVMVLAVRSPSSRQNDLPVQRCDPPAMI